MSARGGGRGGRGGGRGGRGGRGGGPGGALANIPMGGLTFDDLKSLARDPHELFPDVPPPDTAGPSEEERRSAKQTMLILEKLKYTPFFHRSTSRRTGLQDRYSDRYRTTGQISLITPRQQSRMDKNLFPAQIWAMEFEGRGPTGKVKPRKGTKAINMDQLEKTVEGGQLGEDAREGEEEREGEDEEMEVEDEDEEDANDYDDNYFDNGEDEFGGEEDGDGGGGGDDVAEFA